MSRPARGVCGGHGWRPLQLDRPPAHPLRGALGGPAAWKGDALAAMIGALSCDSGPVIRAAMRHENTNKYVIVVVGTLALGAFAVPTLQVADADVRVPNLVLA